MGLVLRRLAIAEGRSDYADRAIIEFTAAIFHYEQAGHERYCANNLNNLAMLQYKLRRFQEAHEHLNRAVKIFKHLDDPGNVAQVNETRTRALIAEGRYKGAEQVINDVVKTLEQGGESALLADALTLQGIVLARLGDDEKSLTIIRRAMNLAADSGSPCNAAFAALTLIEEHAERLSEAEIYHVYRRANELLKESQDAEEIARLRAASLVVAKKLLGPEISGKDFNLTKVVRKYEARFIEQALELEQGSITRAAKKLGIHHESLNHLLRKWHRSLLPKRKPAAKRKRRISKAHLIARRRPVRILHVEDNPLVSKMVKETLEMEGWNVEIHTNALPVLKQLQGNARCDLLLVDNELPGMQGINLISEVRKLSHRKHLPIIMLSADDCKMEALQAGANIFLSKPDDVFQVAPAVARLLKPAEVELFQRR
jgi:DNA-binding NtrC family response regulator